MHRISQKVWRWLIKKTTRGSGWPIFTKDNLVGFMAEWCGPFAPQMFGHCGAVLFLLGNCKHKTLPRQLDFFRSLCVTTRECD